MSQAPANPRASAGKFVDLTELSESDGSSKKTSIGTERDRPVKSESQSSKLKPTKLRTVTRAEKEEIAQRFAELDNEGMIQAAKLIKIGLHESGMHEMADQADKALDAGNDIDLQLDQIPEESLHELLKLIRKTRRNKTTTNVVVLDDDDDIPPKIASSPFQISQSKGAAWPLRKKTALSVATPQTSHSANAKGPPSQTSSPLSAAATRSLPLLSTSKPQPSSSKLKTEVYGTTLGSTKSPLRKSVLKRNPGVDIHDLTGDVEVIDLDDEYRPQPKRLNAQERTNIQREVLGKELFNCTVAKVLFHEQQDLNEAQLRISLQQMKTIFEQFPRTTSSISNFKSSRDMPSYNATTRYAAASQPSVSSAVPTQVTNVLDKSTVLANDKTTESISPLSADVDRMTTGPSRLPNRHQSPGHASVRQPLALGNGEQPSSIHVTQSPRRTTPSARAKKNPGHSTMRMIKSKIRAGVALEKDSNAGTASPVIHPITVPADGERTQMQRDVNTMIPVQSIEESVSTLPPSRQSRRLQAPLIERPVDSAEHLKRTGRQVSTSSTPDLRQSDNTPDTIGSGMVAHTMQAHIEEYKSSHLTLVKSLLRSQNNSFPRESQPDKVNYCSFDKLVGVSLPVRKGFASTQFSQLGDKDRKSCKTYSSRGHDLPFFSIYAPIRSSYLAPNQERLNTVPWINLGDNGDGFEEEVREAYKLEDDDQRERNTIAKQHAVQLAPTLAKSLRTFDLDERQMLKYLIDYQMNTAWIPDDVKSYVIRDGQIRSKWSIMLRRVPQLSSTEVERANDVCQAFYSSERRSIWYLIRHLFEKTQLVESEAVIRTHPDYSSSRCRICHTFHCLLHGELVSTREDLQLDVDAPHGDGGAADSYSDEEDPATINHQLVLRPRVLGASDSMHIAYRWSKQQLSLSVRSRDLMSFPGAEDSVESEHPYAGCSNTCFWLKQNRVPFPDSDWTAAKQADLRQLLSSYGSSNRAPCYISRILGKSCVTTFVEILRAAETLQEPPEETQCSGPSGKAWYLSQEPTKAESRGPFRPCSHEGPCAEADCSCVQEEVPCEKTCACFPACEHMFRGCKCKRIGKICWQNKNCDCSRFGRECDEDLCGTCGADEALDPLNRYKRLDRVCGNVSIQRGITKKTLTGKSEVIGFGLFAAESMKAGDFISEYVGQSITEEESSRRGQVYHRRSVFYEYNMGDKRVTDGTTAGNKSRLMNHTHNARRINVTSKLLICNGIVRLGFFAVRDLEPGTELVYDYGVDESKTKEWMEKIDGQLVPMAARKPGKVVRIKIQKKAKKQVASAVGVGHSVSNAAVAAFAASDDSSSSSDSEEEDPMDLDLGPVRVDDSADDDYDEAGSDGATGSVRRQSRRTARTGTRSQRHSPVAEQSSGEEDTIPKQSPHGRKSPSNPFQRELERLLATPWAISTADLQSAFGLESASNVNLLATLRDQATTHARHIDFTSFMRLASAEHERRCANTSRPVEIWTPGDLVKAGEAAFGMRGSVGMKRKHGQSVGSVFDDNEDDDDDDDD